MKKATLTVLFFAAVLPLQAMAGQGSPVPDGVIATQRAALEKNTNGKGFGPQAPRDIELFSGGNSIFFDTTLAAKNMTLCNIHFHENAEHKRGEFAEYVGNGDGQGYGGGYQYSGALTAAKRTKSVEDACPGDHGSLQPGATIEVHYVYSSAQVNPGPTLGACLSNATSNPQLRVEAQVYVLVNDVKARDFIRLTEFGRATDQNKTQAFNIPTDTGTPVQYRGSTTGPSYNEEGSPMQVSWSVRPRVAKVSIKSVGQWWKGNVFEENHAHGVRNLVTNPKLLSEINKLLILLERPV
jgi:hypothetical protein